MDVFNLYAKIVFDSADYEKGLEKASKNTSKIGAKIGKAFSTIAKVGVAAIGTASVAVGKLVAESVAAYSNYEQLVGGVETLFGAGGLSLEEYADRVGKTVDEISSKYASLMAAQNDVMNNARNAYKNAGMSANEYMENVSGFAAALNSSLGGDTEAAASIADMAINDMADNANKMGSSMESIQNAYQGFAKQNYTMLDNLKIGYGGTKSEMERLLADAEKISGKKFDISSLSDIIEAIHVIQDEMGITGTTAEEARKTIQGSLNMTKAAWANLVVGIADDTADFDQLVDNFVESVVIASENILPRVGKALNGVAQLVERLFPTLAARIPDLIRQILPALLTGAIGLVTTLVGEMPAILSALWDAITATWATLTAQFPILGNIESAAVSAMGKVRSALEPLKDVFQDAWQKIKGIWDTVEPYFAMTWESIKQVFSTAWDAIKAVWDVVGPYYEAIWEGIKSIFSAVPGWLPGIWETAWAAIKGVWNAVTGFFANIWNTIAGIFSVVEAVFKGDFEGAWEAIKGIVSGWANYFKSVWESIKEVFSAAVDVGKKIVNDIKEGISKAWGGIKEWFRGLWNSLFGGLKANVTVNRSVSGGATNGSHANGLDYVPFDGYIAELHKGEMVLTADEAKALRKGSTSGEYKTKTISAAESSLSKALGGMKIYLDSGELVGGISSKMDKSLGTIKTVRARYAT